MTLTVSPSFVMPALAGGQTSWIPAPASAGQALHRDEGAQAERSLGNFKIGWEKQPAPIVRALDVAKRALGRNGAAQRDELHRWPAILFRPSDVQNGSTPSSEVPLLFTCAKQWRHNGEHNQAPKQVLGVVTLHAICEE